ncbi:MAG: hypothetical protein ACOCTK_02080 [Candidatus Saliniplasma sp.]
MSLKEDISKKYKKMRWLKKKYGLEYPTVWKDKLKKAREEGDYKKISEVLDDMMMDLEIQKEEKVERKRGKQPEKRRKKKSIFQRFIPEKLLDLDFGFSMRGYHEEKKVDGELVERYNAEEILRDYMCEKDIAIRVLKVFVANNEKDDVEEVLGKILQMDVNKELKEKYWGAGKSIFKGNKSFGDDMDG